MKKNYFKLWISLSVFFFCVVVIGSVALTYLKINECNKDIWQDNNHMFEQLYSFIYDDMFTQNSMDDEKKFLLDYYKLILKMGAPADGSAMYSAIYNSKGEKIAYSGNFFIVRNSGRGEIFGEDCERILFMGDTFVDDDKQAYFGINDYKTGGVTISGMCDDVYIYADSIGWNKNNCSDLKYNYYFDKSIYDNISGVGEKIDFNEWLLDGKLIFNTYTKYPYDHEIRKEKKKLTKIAEKLCEQEFENAEYISDSHYESKLMLSTMSGYYMMHNGNVLTFSMVTNPFKLGIKKLKNTYIFIAVFTLVGIGIIGIMVTNLSIRQKNIENIRINMTRSIAHELKTPVSIVRGYVENWEYIDENERGECSKKIIEEMDHMNLLITDMLQLAGMEAKAVQPVKEVFNLYEMNAAVLKRLNKYIEEKSIDLIVICDCKEKANVNADLKFMNTVLTNFITNAIQHAEKQIEISILITGSIIRYEIKNDGELLDENDIEHVWDVFYKTDTKRNEITESTGIGLAIVKNILELHGAKYGCRTEKDKMVFWFEIKGEI